jgi:hypothetical protein
VAKALGTDAHAPFGSCGMLNWWGKITREEKVSLVKSQFCGVPRTKKESNGQRELHPS